MKSLNDYITETIFDQEASLDNVINTREIDAAGEYLNAKVTKIDGKNHAITLRVESRSYRSWDDFINKLKKQNIVKLILETTDNCVQMYFDNDVVDFEFECEKGIEFASSSRRKTNHQNIKIKSKHIFLESHSTKAPVFDNCEFECDRLELSTYGLCSTPRLGKGCKVRASELVVTVKDNKLAGLRYYDQSSSFSNPIYVFPDKLPFSFIPVDYNVLKTIGTVILEGYCHHNNLVIMLTNTKSYGVMETKTLHLKFTPWKYISINKTRRHIRFRK